VRNLQTMCVYKVLNMCAYKVLHAINSLHAIIHTLKTLWLYPLLYTRKTFNNEVRHCCT